MYQPDLRANKERVRSADGSYTLYSAEFQEAYHSTRDGALHESLQKHVIPALHFKREKSSLVILDICFGLGYNTLATLYYIKEHNLPIRVHVLSPEFDEGLIRSLIDFEYPKVFEGLRPIIEALSQHLYYEDDQFTIEILLGDARQSVPKIEQKIDVVYQDAFSPRQNPLLWTREFFADIVSIAKEDMLLTTYSTAAATRLGLYENGLVLHEYQGENTRRSLVASRVPLKGLIPIDMELKKERNPTARSLRDIDYQIVA